MVGCESVPVVRPPSQISMPGPGFYHSVERGQTLWRISKIYGVDLDEVVRINRISDVSSIEIGQRIFIPGDKKPVVAAQTYEDDDFIWPARGRVISSFSATSNNMVNKGLNIEPRGSLDVVAVRKGKVVFRSDRFGEFGKTIIIDHGDGFSTIYARNSDILVRLGEHVDKGVVIAKAGSGERDKNTYLHFEIRKRGLPQNPNFYLP